MGLTVPDDREKFGDPGLNLEKFHPKPSDTAFSKFDKYRPEAAGDVISDVTLDYVGTGVHARFGDHRLCWPNYSTLWLAGPAPL